MSKYIDREIANICEEFKTSIELLGHTTGQDMFNTLVKLRKLSWKDCVGLSTYDAATMTGYKTGLPNWFVQQKLELWEAEAGKEI